MKFFAVLACCVVAILICSAATKAAAISGSQESMPPNGEDVPAADPSGSAGGDAPRKPFKPDPRTFFALFPLLFPDYYLY